MSKVSVFAASSDAEPAVDLDSLRHPFALNVDVLSGVHAGVRQRIEGDEAIIGSGPDCDIILFADPVADQHVAVTPKSGFGSTVIVTALNGSVTLDNGTVLDAGEWSEARMPLDLLVGGTHVTVSRTINPGEFTRPALAAASALALIIAGPNIVNTAFSSVTSGSQDRPAVSASRPDLRTVGAATPDDAARGVEVASETSAPAPLSGVEAIVGGLRSRLGEAGLAHLVEASAGSDGTVLVSGEIGEEHTASWRRVLRWYDSVPRAPGLVNAVRVGTPPEMPAIASVWLMGEREVTLASGERLRVGDRARGGWTVVAIENDGVVLNRNGADVTLAF